ncbi:permease [Candidatus Peregrinibacteria bacterium CG10_big_fil_rev_8_21_14_0_10_55_24]|nr:MAG: permease [Candidatus Peregrinibacteria bacterium CG10_big_fil_rev_8_21_14_0_10_55_24]
MQFLVERVLLTPLGIPLSSPLGGALVFFIEDSVKILLLLILITHVMGLVRYYLPVRRIRSFLAAHRLFGLDYFLATIFGAVTPFCSCSSIPLFIGFLEAGIPLGVTLAFLIISPLINEVAIALFLSVFGWKVTLAYVGAGIALGMAGGAVLGSLRLERFVADVVRKDLCSCTQKRDPVLSAVSRDAWRIVRSVAPYVLAGVAVGAAVHGFVPEGFFAQALGRERLWTVPLAVLLAVPLYANASGVIPIVQALVEKGIPLGTALAFMMAVVGLSLPEALILKRVMRWPLLASFFATVMLAIIIIGYAFNIVL